MNEKLSKSMLELQYLINKALEEGSDSGVYNTFTIDGKQVFIKFNILDNN